MIAFVIEAGITSLACCALMWHTMRNDESLQRAVAARKKEGSRSADREDA